MRRPLVNPAATARPSLDDAAVLAEQMRQENEALGLELLRCYEQLNLVFDITENIATLRDPATIQRALLRRFGEMLGAGAMFVESDQTCQPIEALEGVGRPITVDSAELRQCLNHDIALVRRTHRARVARAVDLPDYGDGRPHVLLAPLRQLDAETAVVIVLRPPDVPAFDSGDVLAAESVLGYGGHILANVVMVRHLQQTAVETVRALANAIDAKDNYTCGHSERVGWLARLAGMALGLPDSQMQVLEWAGILHDVGKIGISDRILKKPGRLSPREFEEMKRHPRRGYEMLKPVASLGPALDAVLYHHENWDGTGYPQGLHGEDIPLYARIIRVVDMFDALTSTRSYRQGYTMAQAMDMLEQEAGRGTDPHVTAVFLDALCLYVRTNRRDFERRFVHAVGARDLARQLNSPEPAIMEDEPA
ncbi:MAG: HD-GYP domain-containing protein [Phycisphaerae bacterium]|jgi:HD-GYP domain-containing protein (c-di-GMP phosphodiesterase class II)